MSILRGETLLRELQRLIAANAARERPLGVLLVGVHGLRRYNVQHGLASGEALVARIVDLIGAALRPGDLVLRVGSADLLVVLPEVRDTGHAMLAASRLLRQFENTIEVAGLPSRPTCARRCSATTSRSIASRSSTSPRTACTAPSRSRAGGTRSAASSAPTCSCRWPRTPG